MDLPTASPYVRMQMNRPLSPDFVGRANRRQYVCVSRWQPAGVALWDRDEPRFAETSRQNAAIRRLGRSTLSSISPRTAKPALIYWCQGRGDESLRR